MTLTFTNNQVLVAAILLLIAIQIYQHSLIKKLQKETDSIWTQVSTIVTSISSQLMNINDKLKDKQDKE